MLSFLFCVATSDYKLSTYSTDGGTTEGSYFVEYITAKNMADAKRILRAELKAAGYKNIKMDAIEA